MGNLVNNMFITADRWARNNAYKSYDVSDVKTIPFFLFLTSKQQRYPLLKKVFFLFLYLAENNANILRKLFKIKKKKYPQAQAMIARAYFAYYRSKGDNVYLSDACEILSWLETKTLFCNKHYCWGQPFDWPSKVSMPANTPRATVTSQVIHSFLDGYEITKNTKYLNIAIDACRFFIECLNHEADNDGDICFSYTNRDKYQVHNASMLAAAALVRTWVYSGIEEFKIHGEKAANFTAKHQNQDGSWNYSAHKNDRIDNFHTGFVLDSYCIIKKNLGNQFAHDQVLLKGAQFYLDSFFYKQEIPKMTPENIYPIDIQSCAQSLISLAELEDVLPNVSKNKWKSVFEWISKEMYSQRGYFYYRIYKNGKRD